MRHMPDRANMGMRGQRNSKNKSKSDLPLVKTELYSVGGWQIHRRTYHAQTFNKQTGSREQTELPQEQLFLLSLES